MNATLIVLNVVAFLCTYLVHSTILMAVVWIVVAKFRWPADPGLRSRLLKLSFVIPLVTTILLSNFGAFHVGPELAFRESDVDEVISVDRRSIPDSASERDTQATHSVVEDWVPESEESSIDEFPSQSHPFVGDELSDVDAAAIPTSESSNPIDWRHYGSVIVVILWIAIAVAGLIRLSFQWVGLRRVRLNAQGVVEPGLVEELERQRTCFGIPKRVLLRASANANVPFAAGIIRPYILIPNQLRSDRLASAMIAHELAHVANRDALWNLLTQVVCRVFFFQPFNWLAFKALRFQMDFDADSKAASILGERLALVQCLYTTGNQLSERKSETSPALVLASGMAMFQSTLGQRIEALLDENQTQSSMTNSKQLTILAALLLGALITALVAPRAVIDAKNSNSIFTDGNESMNRTVASLLVVVGLGNSVATEEPALAAPAQQDDSARQNTTPDELPEGVRQFNGMLVGRIASKDVEKGTFTVTVDAVSRVWRNSRAEDPRSLVGKTVEITGVFGKFLDVLVVTRVGETLEFECKHDGDDLVFPGELLRKVAPYDPEDYPILPEEFRGFRGRVSAEIVKKDPETFEMIIRVNDVLGTWNENSAEDPNSIEGKSMLLAGFWNRREEYHNLKDGDRIDVGMQHVGRRSDHMMVAEGIKKIGANGEREMNREERRSEGREERMERAANPTQGFRGMLVGRLVEKDAERGTFTVTVDAVPRVWQNNRSANPKALIGKNVAAEGVSGRMIDALVVAKVGDTIEFGALHEEGPRVRVGEVLRKVAPVEPGDYPELPNEFRGFRGMVTGKVVRKGDEIWEVIVEIEEVHDLFDGNRAEDPQSIVGKQVMLAGFWNRKDDYHDIRVGDRIRCGMNHTQRLSDHLSVVESIRKVDD